MYVAVSSSYRGLNLLELTTTDRAMIAEPPMNAPMQSRDIINKLSITKLLDFPQMLITIPFIAMLPSRILVAIINTAE
jgi:hypothetical protein